MRISKNPTLEELKKIMDKNEGGSLDLSGTQITSLPSDLVVNGTGVPCYKCCHTRKQVP